MDGLYQNKRDQLISFLDNWIIQVLKDSLWEKYVDLHIDEIDAIFKNKENWISGSLFVLECIRSLIDKSKYDVILAIPLSSLSTPLLVDFLDFREIECELDLTPPSFYLFPKGEVNYEQTIKDSKYLEEISIKEEMEIFYGEKQEGNEVYRTVYVKK